MRHPTLNRKTLGAIPCRSIMTKEELLELLKENLTIEISKVTPYYFMGDKPDDDVTVKVYFAGELITEGSS